MGITVQRGGIQPALYRTCVLLCQMFVLVQLVLPSVRCHAFGSNAPVLVAHDAPVGTIVLDLMQRTDTVPQHSVVSLDTSDYSHLFRLNDKRQIVTRASISRLLDSIVTLDILVTDGLFERVVPFAVHIVARPTVHFSHSVFNGTVASDAAVNSQIVFDQRISAHTIGSTNARYAIISGNTQGLFKLVTKQDPYQDTYALLFVALPLSDASGVHELQIKAVDENNREQFATAVLRVAVEDRPHEPPVFTAQRYVVSVPQLAPQTTVVRVSATTTNGAVLYRLEPEDIPFDVIPWSGEIFSSQWIDPGRYTFNAVAVDAIGQTAFVSVKIIVEGELDPFPKKPQSPIRRARRDLGSDMVITLREDTPLGYLQNRIDLLTSERIRGAPVVKNFVTVHANGSIELTKALNYEDINPVEVTVFVENVQGGDVNPQRVIINVLNVDEPPAFVNGQKPFLAVVSLNPPKTGLNVFQFVARDENGDGDSDVEYRLINTEPPGMFRIEPSSGIVRTTRTDYELGKTYRVFVQARDRTPQVADKQDSEIAVLEVLAGDRPPQFVQQQYNVGVPEDTDVEASVVDVKAHGFKSIDGRNKGPITYSLFADENSDGHGRLNSDAFSIDSRSGVVHLQQKLDFDDGKKPRLHKLRVVAAEAGLESEVPLEITVTDTNDNPPVFSLPLYTATIKEDIPIGSLIVKVRATDKDSGRNAAIRYEVDDDHFFVNDHGDIEARKRLDADQKSQGFHIYRFNVTARDMGEPSLSSKALVHIRTENTNDEAPYFIPTRQYTAYVAEDAQGGTPIVTIQALDPDRDQVSYSFVTPDGETAITELFEIDKDTGLIKLRMGTKPEDLSQNGMHVYNLTVQAKDDGSCCDTTGTVIHKETATVLIGIADVNNNKPEFHHCSTYSSLAKIEEGVHKNGSTIIKVVATDDDSPPNGDIVYSLYYPKSESRKPFIIDPITGELRPSPYVMFDRETLPFEDVTVKATDKGERPLIGFCQFTVTVIDVNDNAPQFDRASYETSIALSMAVGHSVVTVFADDRDAPANARITYELKADDSAGEEFADDPTYFRIMKTESGEVTLTKSIPPEKSKFKFLVVANDNGSPEPQKSEVSVVINLHKSHQSAPQWIDSADCPAQTEVVENVQVNSLFFRCHAVSGANPDNPISYSMANGVKRSTNSLIDFREFLEKRGGRDWVVVRNLKGLDFEKTSNYTLTLTATDLRSGVTADKQLRVLLIDKNDEVPRFTVDRFTGTIDEELTPEMFATKSNNQPITIVEAVDADSPGPQNEVRYSILRGPASGLFRIDERSGAIYPLAKFDREKNDSFILDVEARDGMDSDLPGAEGPNKDIVKVQIFIGDINDNAPYFNKTSYKGLIAENAEIGQGVMTVKAHDADRDSNLKYDLKGKNSERIEFGVRADSGTIFVKEPLDFETRKEYSLTLLVTDGKHESSTSIFIQIEDVNDNAPQFEKTLYETTIQEEDGHVPKTLFIVKATDRDEDQKSRDIVYRLEGQGVGEFFQVDEKSGEIRAMKPLDRDLPAGVPTWKFIVQAIDDSGRGLIGYADVQVNLRDINDNAPFFANDMVGLIDENRDPGSDGVFVMTAAATDYDDPITPNADLIYGIVVNKELNGQPVFSIDPKSGKIFAKTKLDRENAAQRQFVIEVRASDKGRPPLYGVGNVTIKVVDVNDNAPFFEQKEYSGSVAETAAVGAAVLSVSAQDADTEAADNVLQYELVENNDPGLQYFYMTSEADSSASHVGVLRVKKPLDYEDPTQRDGFRLEVKVFDGKFSATAKLFVKVDDRNDNPPEIRGPSRANVSEDAVRGIIVARFTTIDKDLDGKDTATFRIARESDPKRQFSISQGGELTVAQALDREDIPYYNLKIEAFDQVGNVGSQGIEIFILDVNDNAPDLYTVPNPCIFMENTDPGQIPPCEIFGKDPDTRPNGPPFKMRLDPSYPFASLITITFDPNGDGGNGTMTVRAAVRFDREDPNVGKVLNIPIFVKDSGANATEARRIVQIIIGDENDNPMTDGAMTILVNSYLGQLERTVIGRVYVTDKDDWDLPDKTFQWSQSLPGFDLNRDNGQITMDANKPPGSYDLTVSVTDNKRNEKATGTVTVVVKEIPDVAFRNQGAIRLLGRSKDSQDGISKADFILQDSKGSSPMMRFIAKLSDYLGGVQVDVFSVMDGVAVKQNSEVNVVDVRYAAHGSPYRSSVWLNGVVSQHRTAFEKEMGVQIIGISIDMCKFTQCDSGCQTIDTPSTKGVTVDANATALVGIFTTSKDDCVCPVFFPPPSCELGLCHNQGVCHNTYPGFFCECRNSLLKGPRCQGRTRSFTGKGFAWYKPMPACTSLNISFEFMTTQANALLFYGGPMSGMSDPDILYNDFVVIKLLNGKVSASLNFNGNGVNQLDVSGLNSASLNDGKWHSVAIIQDGQDLELIVDNCQDLQETAGGLQGTTDDSSCRTVKQTNDDDERLNIVDPVQIGGVAVTDDGQYPQGVTDVSALNGCIRNLVVNNDLYDLNTPAYSEGSTIGCAQWGSACDSNSVDSASYCINGDCYADMNGKPKCDCDPGFRGDRCQKQIQWVQFGVQSFIEYLMKVPLKSTTTKVDVLFLPGQQSTGELGYGKSVDLKKYISTSVGGNLPTAEFDLDFKAANGQPTKPVQLQMDWLRLQNNGSYWLQFDRNPTRASLSIDGVYHVDQLLDPRSQNFAMNYDDRLMLGADTTAGTKDFQGCVGDFRWDDFSLPLIMDDEENLVAPIHSQKSVVPGCSLRRNCAQLGAAFCSGSYVCVDFWKGPICTCPTDSTTNIGDDGTLIGCGAVLAVSSLGISSKAVVLILICLLVLIMLVLIMVVYTRRQTPPFQRVQPEEMSRENMRPYDIEGGGEADNDTYNISGLRKPVMPPELNGLNGRAPSVGPALKPPAPGVPVDDNLKAMIRDLEADPNMTAPYDELRVYDDEGDGISQCSLSSLSSSGSDPGELDERLERWGPRFQKLAGMYAGQEE